MSRKIKNRVGIRYGRLIVIQFASKKWVGYTLRPFWLCKCDCGNETIVSSMNLQSGDTQSCGCFRKEIMSKKDKTGKNNPNYIHGKDCGKITSLKEIKVLKEKIRKRDNYTCQECNKTQEQNIKETGRKLEVHHIDGDDTNNVEENLKTLCRSCHSKLKGK